MNGGVPYIKWVTRAAGRDCLKEQENSALTMTFQAGSPGDPLMIPCPSASIDPCFHLSTHGPSAFP